MNTGSLTSNILLDNVSVPTYAHTYDAEDGNESVYFGDFMHEPKAGRGGDKKRKMEAANLSEEGHLKWDTQYFIT